MRILFLNHNVVHTGTYQRASCLARELVAAGHELTLVTTSRDRRSEGSEREWFGVRVIEAPDLLSGSARTGWDPWNTLWRVRRLARQRFDLIHAFDSRPAVILPALALHRTTGAPLFMDWADWWGRGGTIRERSGWATRTLFGPVETWFEEAFRTGATAHTTIVDTLRERCIALGVPAARVLTLPNGCVPPPEPRLPKAEARAALGVDAAPLLLHIGVMLPADATFIFDALRRVRRTLPDTRLVLVGHCRARVPADLNAAVTRTGFVDDARLQTWRAAADVGLLVLRDTVASRGRWPGKLSDYLSGGVPIVMTRVGAAAAMIGDAGAAVLAPPTPAGFADAVIATVRDGAAQSRLGARAFELAAGELSWHVMARRLVTFYREQAAGAEPGPVHASPRQAAS